MGIAVGSRWRSDATKNIASWQLAREGMAENSGRGGNVRTRDAMDDLLNVIEPGAVWGC